MIGMLTRLFARGEPALSEASPRDASAIAFSMRAASAGRFSGAPSLYFLAVTFPLHPLT